MEYSGRVMEFSENQTRLENAYQTAIVPDEILAISQTLGWTTHKELDYEMLIALAYDGSRGTKPSFEKMMDNIFNKYNPSKHLPWGKPFNENAYTSFHYFHSQDGWFTSSVETYQMRNKEYLRLYPEYERGGETIRKNFGNAQKINELKTICRKNLENNAYNYINTFIKIDSKPNIFTSYVVSPDKISSSSPTGYRKITLNEETLTKYHYGEDIAVPKGTPVYAVMDGIVVHAQGKYKKEGKAVGLWGGGNSVIIRKDLYDAKGEPCYLYVMICHMENKSVTVKKGQKITAGTQIGTAGMTGTATGPHVHMQTWMSKKKYNSFKKGDFVYVEPQEYTRNDTADRIDIDSDDYTIYLDGTMFYDVTYRNKVYGR